MSKLGRIWEVVLGAVSHRHPPELPQPNGEVAQREQIMRSAEDVEERSRERVRRGSREVRELASRVIRKVEGRSHDGDHHTA